MIKKLPTEVKVGAFVALALIGLGFLTTQIDQKGFSFQRLSPYHIKFDDVSGLLKNTPVEYSGIRVGHVDKIELDGSQIRVTIVIDPDVKLYRDSRVEVQSRGLLGERIIMLSGGGNAPLVEPGGTLGEATSRGSFNQAMEDFSELSQFLKKFLKGGEGAPSVEDIIENTTMITEEVRQLVEGRTGDMNELIENLAVASKGLRQFMESTEDTEIDEAVSDFRGMMAKLDNSLTGLEKIVAKIERGEGTIGRLVHDESTIEKVDQALDGVNEFVGDARRFQVSVGFRGEYLTTAESTNSVASLRIQPSQDKHFLFEFTDGPLHFSKRRSTVEETTTTPPGETVEEKTVTQTDEFSLTALFARRFYDVTLKAGLIRSSGGFGLEYHLFRDHLDLGFEAFNFNREERPHFRLFSRAHFLDIFYLTGGVDDLIHRQGHRNYFLGAGMMLTDDDLRRLLGLATLAR